LLHSSHDKDIYRNDPSARACKSSLQKPSSFVVIKLYLALLEAVLTVAGDDGEADSNSYDSTFRRISNASNAVFFFLQPSSQLLGLKKL